MHKALLVAAALLAAPPTLLGQDVRGGKDVPSTQASPKQMGAEPAAPAEAAGEQSRLAFKERVAEAVESIEAACAGDIDEFCGRVSPGEGRIALCMLAHEDALSARCRFGLYRTARKLKSDVGQIAETCLQEMQSLCGEGGRVRQCLEDKKSSLSSSCQTIVGAVGQRVREQIGLTGTDVYSADNKNLGKVVQVIKGPDNKVQSIQVDIGRVLGLGTKVVTITADKLEQLPGVRLRLRESDVRSLPEAKKQ